MSQATFKILVIAALLVAIPMGAGGLVIFLSAAAPLLVIAILVTVIPLALIAYFTDRSQSAELATRFRLLGRNRLWKRVRSKGKDLKKTSLKETDLSELHLQGADLSYSNLEKASLERSDLHGATLIHADLRQANLKGANLEDVSCDEAIWEGAIADENTVLPFSREEAEKKGVVFITSSSA